MEIVPKLPLERRRRDSSSYRLPGIPSQYELSYMRREGDFARMRSQRWIDLADTALGRRKPARRGSNSLSKSPVSASQGLEGADQSGDINERPETPKPLDGTDRGAELAA
jgi:hypothetical protein